MILIFTDLTTSTGSDLHIGDISENLKSIVLKAPYESEIIVYPIDRSMHVQPIMEFTKPAKPGNTTMSKAARKEMDAAIEAAQANIQHLYEDVYLPARNEPNSCLLNSLYKAHSVFSRYERKAQLHFELVFMSDMLEECELLPGELLFIRNNGEAFSKYVSTYEPGVDLSYADLTIVMSTQANSSDSHSIGSIQLEKLWREALKRHGYSGEKLADIPFNTLLPEKYQYTGE